MAFQPPKSSIRKGVYWKISSKRFVTPSWFATVSMISMLGKPVRGWEKVMENWKDTCVVEVVIQYLLPFIGPDWKSKVGVDGWEYFFSGVLLLKFQWHPRNGVKFLPICAVMCLWFGKVWISKQLTYVDCFSLLSLLNQKYKLNEQTWRLPVQWFGIFSLMFACMNTSMTIHILHMYVHIHSIFW